MWPPDCLIDIAEWLYQQLTAGVAFSDSLMIKRCFRPFTDWCKICAYMGTSQTDFLRKSRYSIEKTLFKNQSSYKVEGWRVDRLLNDGNKFKWSREEIIFAIRAAQSNNTVQLVVFDWQELSSNEDINNWMASVGISQDALKLLPRLIRHSQSRRISNDPSGGWKPDPWMRARLDKRNAELINSLLGLPRIMKVVGKK